MCQKRVSCIVYSVKKFCTHLHGVVYPLSVLFEVAEMGKGEPRAQDKARKGEKPKGGKDKAGKESKEAQGTRTAGKAGTDVAERARAHSYFPS